MATPTLSLAEANAWLQHYLTDAICWLAFHSTDPTRLGDIGSEIGGGGYIRQRVLFGAPSGGAVSNTNSLIFSNTPGSTLKWVSVWNAQYNGGMKLYVRITDLIVPNTQQILVAPGDIAISV